MVKVKKKLSILLAIILVGCSNPTGPTSSVKITLNMVTYNSQIAEIDYTVKPVFQLPIVSVNGKVRPCDNPERFTLFVTEFDQVVTFRVEDVKKSITVPKRRT